MTRHNATKTYKVSELVRALEYQYPLGISTFSPCMKCRNKGARGGGVCPTCVEDELAELIGRPLAWEVHQSLKTYNMIKYAAIYGSDDESKDQEATS
jgi:hypothetical protein